VILFGLTCGALFTFIIGSFGTRFVLHMYETGQQSNDLEAPMWIVYMAIPAGSYLMCFRFVQVALAFHRTGELPHTDESHVEGVEPIPEEVLVEAGVKPDVAHAGGGVR
jgi:C4-dicarboxylate transporter DctM subunit